MKIPKLFHWEVRDSQFNLHQLRYLFLNICPCLNKLFFSSFIFLLFIDFYYFVSAHFFLVFSQCQFSLKNNNLQLNLSKNELSSLVPPLCIAVCKLPQTRTTMHVTPLHWISVHFTEHHCTSLHQNMLYWTLLSYRKSTIHGTTYELHFHTLHCPAHKQITKKNFTEL